jgi:nitrogen fixation NifU-like protein
MDANLRREIILDNYSNPANKEEVNSDKYIKVNSNNESCIDNIDLWVLIEDGIIKDIKFDGEACAISTASTSIMTKELVGKTIKEAEDFIQNFNNMINEEPFNSEMLEEANAFDEIYKQANRKTCATLPYKGIQRAIDKYKQE